VRGSGRGGATGTACVLFGAFAAPAAVLGVVWPDVRERFDQPLGALGVLTLVYGIGRFATSGSAGVVVRRWGMATATVAGALVLLAGCVLAAVAPAWGALVAAAGVIGLASGSLDSLGGRYLATRGDVAEAGLVHGSYGVGSTLAPLLAIALAWRSVFVACAGLALLAAFAAWRAHDRWPDELHHLRDAADITPPGREPRPPLAGAAVSVALFCVFVGLEVTIGNWALTYLTEGRDVSGARASAAVAAFWAGITVGRLVLGRLGRGRDAGFLRFTVTAALVALLATAALPGGFAVVTLLVTGLALAPTMPTLLATTAQRVGSATAGRVSGWQLLGANVGATSAPAVTGILVGVSGVRVAAAMPIVLAVTGLVLVLVVTRSSPMHPVATSASSNAIRPR
jgi:fucose permease